MIILRLLVLAFNVVIVTYLVYRMIQVAKLPLPKTKKVPIIGTGIFLLIVPFSFFLNIMPPSMLYFLLYPVAVSLFVYLIREEDSR